MKSIALKFCASLAVIVLPIAANSITTTFSGLNGFSGNMFTVTAANPLVITSVALNLSNTAVTIDVYDKVGSYVGFETNPAAWTLESQTNVTGLGEGLATPVSTAPFSLTAGVTYSLYITIDGAGGTMYYSDGSATYSNADLSLALGEGLGGLFGSNGVFTPRTWDGTITYSPLVAVGPEPASFALLAFMLPAIWLLRRKRA